MREWNEYQDLYRSGEFKQLIDEDPQCINSFFPLAALVETQQYKAAILQGQRHLLAGCSDPWLIQLYLIAMEKEPSMSTAIKKIFFRQLIDRAWDLLDSLDASVVYAIAKAGSNFGLTREICNFYERFLQISDGQPESSSSNEKNQKCSKRVSICICHQNYASPDFTQRSLSAICELVCDSQIELHILVLQDGLPEMASEELAKDHEATCTVIRGYEEELSRKFLRSTITFLDTNKGPSRACKIAIDTAMEKVEYCLLVEDDCILSPYAVKALASLLSNLVSPIDDPIFGLESTFFNHKINCDQLGAENVQFLSQQSALTGGYIQLDYVPSTCFAVSRSIWKFIRILRAFPEGPETLNRFVRKTNAAVFAPVLPFAIDIGSSINKKHSYTTNSESGAQLESKNPYYLVMDWASSDPGSNHLLYLSEEMRDLLYSASCNGSIEDFEKLKLLISREYYFHEEIDLSRQ
jgi:hypothetical protein